MKVLLAFFFAVGSAKKLSRNEVSGVSSGASASVLGASAKASASILSLSPDRILGLHNDTVAAAQEQRLEEGLSSVLGASAKASTFILSLSPDHILELYNDTVAAAQKQRLKEGLSQIEGVGDVFADVEPAFPLLPPHVDHPPRPFNVEGTKNIVKTDNLKSPTCVIYAAGIADDSSFEQMMAQQGCEVHAFDCSIDATAASVQGKAFKFHHWCLGKGDASDFTNSDYAHSTTGYQFKTLQSSMAELSDTKVDLLKFDIEGFEWALFRDAILEAPRLPVQLSFELHTQGANPGAVPVENVQDKRRHAVDELFIALYDKGYRVVSKEINPGDHHCAEFILVNVDGLRSFL